MSKEKVVKIGSGWLMLVITIALMLASIAVFIMAMVADPDFEKSSTTALVVVTTIVFIVDCFLFGGFFTLQPNEARVLVLFGSYKGTVHDSGFFWANPFYTNRTLGTNGTSDADAVAAAAGRHSKNGNRAKISLRARTMNGDRIKVNDLHGNPVEIAMVVVWRVHDTAQAVFDVDDYQTYVNTQSETALRHVATAYAYDKGEDEDDLSEITLRSNIEEVSAALKAELETRLAVAGVVVDDARLTHLAYAPEIAQAMLRRQQAEAIIAARKKIVEGAVGMVEMALVELQNKHVLELDDERKAAMVSNLMVVLCGDSEVQPVVNTGTLYA